MLTPQGEWKLDRQVRVVYQQLGDLRRALADLDALIAEADEGGGTDGADRVGRLIRANERATIGATLGGWLETLRQRWDGGE